MEPIVIPRSIDDSPHLLLWSSDEMVPIMVALLLGIFSDRLGICLVISLAFVSVYRRFRDGRPDGYILHLLYWAGIIPCRGYSVRNPFARRFLP